MSITRFRKQCLYRLSLAALTLCFSLYTKAEHLNPLSLYVPSYFDSEAATQRVLKPLINFLSQQLEPELQFVITSSYQTLMYKAIKAEPDLIFAPHFMTAKLSNDYLPIWQTNSHVAYLYSKQKFGLSELKSRLQKQTILAPSRYAAIATMAEQYLAQHQQLNETKDYYILGAGGYDAVITKMQNDKYQFAVLTDTTRGFTTNRYFDELVPLLKIGVSKGTVLLLKRSLLDSELNPLLNQCQTLKSGPFYQNFKASSGLTLNCIDSLK